MNQSASKWVETGGVRPDLPDNVFVYVKAGDGFDELIRRNPEPVAYWHWPNVKAYRLASAAAPCALEVGASYLTQAGQSVKILARCAVDGRAWFNCSDDKCRYTDGRVTGTPHDYSYPDNFKRPFEYFDPGSQGGEQGAQRGLSDMAGADCLYGCNPGYCKGYCRNVQRAVQETDGGKSGDNVRAVAPVAAHQELAALRAEFRRMYGAVRGKFGL